MSIWFKTLDAIAARAIEENPISDLVDTLRRVLEAEYKAVNKATTPSIDFFVEFVSSASPASRSRNLLRDFLAKLAFSPVPGLLFLDPSDTLESAIYRFLSELPKTPQIDLKYSRGLATLLSVIVTDTEQVIDAIVWEALLNIFVESPNLPPTPKTSRLQTPVKGISSSHCRDTETHRDMDPRIRAELDGLVYPDTPLFLETYFLSQHWTHISDSTFQAVSSSISHGKGWQTWPPEPEQNAVLNWFSTFVNGLVSSTNRQYGGSPNKPLGESTTKRKPDIFLYKPLKTLGEESRNSFNWSDILVVGKLKKSCESTLSPSLIVELANYVRLVFGSQHSRRFVHAFTLCGDLMRCWIFHREGAIGSTLFSINEKPDLFISVIMGYALMDMTQLGYDPTVIAGPTGSYVTIPLSDGRRQKFLLALIPFFTSNSIASRGTTCWQACIDGKEGYEYVCKDSWRSYAYCSEGSLLAEAQRLGVEGLVEYIGHEDICIDSIVDDITVNILKGLTLGSPLNLRPSDYRTTSHSGSFSQSANSRRSSHAGSGALTKSRKRSSTFLHSDESQSSTKQRLLGSNVLTDNSPRSYNRVHSRLVTLQGHPIYQFRCNTEFLKALRDAIAGHWSLLKHEILHRDISLNNIMITRGKRKDNYHGFLIDLDLAIRLSTTIHSTAHHRTGTMEFMAIGALEGETHTYRHDLESFFYVFLWVSVHYEANGVKVTPPPRVFDAWGASTYEDAARVKTGDMDIVKFEGILSQFTERAAPFKTLARKLRDELFPFRQGLFTGTDPDSGRLYEVILGHFNTAILSLPQ